MRIMEMHDKAFGRKELLAGAMYVAGKGNMRGACGVVHDICLKHEHCSVQALDALLEVRQGSILETELDYLRCQQRELPVLDHFDSLNAECSSCACQMQSADL